ncbi:protein C19orf12 homolog [Cylas formicarius]|uniref:protein C19orf12 homolog n=1 Tax=Cylas formicarius TaxID=197179 RepID=UPI002958D8D5|nr:protein C19orf12 homolog [Cylas formicarius]XP_060536162.1 protein C19orf12 homolog [Cylas formicarius]
MNSKNRENIVEICSLLAQQENLRVTLIESGKGALIAGFGAFFGGLLAGPPGLAIGGVVSSIGAAWYGQGTYKSVAQVISEMSSNQRRALAEAVTKAIEKTKPQDFVGALSLILTSASLKDVVIAELGSFLMREMQLQMVKQ